MVFILINRDYTRICRKSKGRRRGEDWKIKNFVPFHESEIVYNKIGETRILEEIHTKRQKWRENEGRNYSIIVRICQICYNNMSANFFWQAKTLILEGNLEENRNHG